jgi:RNA polymerase sigma-70 factor, ECF subfamily
VTGSGDGVLVDGLRRGQTEALEALISRYGPRVYRLACGITHREADAQEVVQDVFLSVFRRIGAFEGRSGLWTWIYRMTANAALIKGRGQRVKREIYFEDGFPTCRGDGHRDGDRARCLADGSASPEDALLRRETEGLVRQAITELPDRYQVVVLLRDLDGLSNKETAAVLGDTVPSVKSRLHRARAALRAGLTHTLAGPAPGSLPT